jgi:hypothetical protein
MHTSDDRLDYREGSAPARHRPFCTCGAWVHHRDVDITEQRDRIEVEAAWTEHQLQSMRG